VFVDTEGNFVPDRLKAICERFNVSHETVLEVHPSLSPPQPY